MQPHRVSAGIVLVVDQLVIGRQGMVKAIDHAVTIRVGRRRGRELGNGYRASRAIHVQVGQDQVVVRYTVVQRIEMRVHNGPTRNVWIVEGNAETTVIGND